MSRALLIAVPGVSGVSVPAASSGAEVVFRWPRRGRVTALLAVPRSGVVADAAALSLSILDGEYQAIVSDGRAVRDVPFLALSGRGWRWFAMGAPVERGEPWTWQITNADPVNALVPNVLVRLEEG